MLCYNPTLTEKKIYQASIYVECYILTQWTLTTTFGLDP